MCIQPKKLEKYNMFSSVLYHFFVVEKSHSLMDVFVELHVLIM